MLPTEAPIDGEFAWLSYEGHWGERRPIFNDGPTGPAAKDQWSAPLDWIEEQGRDSAVEIPFGGSTATDAFCDLSREASMALLQLLDHPVRFAVFTVVGFVLLVVVVRYSSRGLLRAAAATYRHHPARLLQIGGALVGGAILTAVVQWFVLRHTSIGDALDVLGDDSLWAVPVLAATAALVVLPIMAWVLAATVELVMGAERGGSIPGRWWLPRVPRATFGAALVLVVALGAASIVLLLLPVAAVVAGRWLVAPVACADGGVGVRAGMRRSAALLHGQRLRAIGLLFTLSLILASTGLLGALLLTLTDASFNVAGIVVTLAAVVVVPYVALVLTHFYAHLTTPPPPAVENSVLNQSQGQI